MYIGWPCPLPQGGTGEESTLSFDHARAHRVLVLPALFDEANKTRHQAIEIMRRLDVGGVDSVIADLPGCNESTASLADQSIASWRKEVAAAAAHFAVTHVLAIRAGAWLAPATLPGWLYAPAKPAQVLRGMLRARTIAAREAGREETSADLLEVARAEGIELAGWELGAALVRELEALEFKPHAAHRVIEAADIGGAPLWLRAEPDFDANQADTLSTLILSDLAE